jgi:hypothetical protein
MIETIEVDGRINVRKNALGDGIRKLMLISG